MPEMLRRVFAVAAIGVVLAGPGLISGYSPLGEMPLKATNSTQTSLNVTPDIQALARTYSDYYQQIRWQNGMIRLVNACYDYDSRRRKKADAKSGEVPTSGRDVGYDLLIADKVTNRPPYYSHLSTRKLPELHNNT